MYVLILMVFASRSGRRASSRISAPRPAPVTRLLETFEAVDVLARPGPVRDQVPTTATFIIFDIELMLVFLTVVYWSLGLYGFVTMVVPGS